MNEHGRDIEELLAGSALGDLSSEEAQELFRSRRIGPAGDADRQLEAELELAAARAASAYAEADPQPMGMPAELRSRLKNMAGSWESGSSGFGASAPRSTGRPIPLNDPRFGWIAAAAAVLIAVSLALNPPIPRTEIDATPPTLAQLEQDAGGRLIRQAWTATDDPSANGASGEVVWDPKSERGVMVFEGLAANDPGESQYQLWIFDSTRPTGELPQFGEGILSQRPVDGGVFDVLEDGRVEVPIDAKLPIGNAVAFAVTVEPPGGVVQSDRSRVPLLAVLGP